MKWLSKEPFSFDDDDYTERAKNMSADALWTRQCKKYRTKVSSSTGIGFSSLMLLPTMGVSTLSLMANGRTLDIARRKRKVIDAEARRRNLPDYQKTKRDLLIPLGVSLTVFATVGLLDILFFGGTSAPVLNGVAEHGINALPTMIHDPSHFFIGLWHGAELQVQQVFHFGSQFLALGADPGHAVVAAGGLHHAANGVAANSIDATTFAAMKGQFAADLHSLATHAASPNPTHLALADKGIQTAALLHATPGTPAELAGASVGFSIMQTAESYAVRCAIADTGLMALPTRNSEKNNEANTTADKNTMRVPESKGDDARLAQAAVLTGESSRSFQFLSKEFRPVSQWVMTPKESCEHDGEKAIASKKCRFCLHDIDPEVQVYYHCCSCSDHKQPTSSGYDICEVCVAGRGCSCRYREDHVLHRKGLLKETVDYGDLTE